MSAPVRGLGWLAAAWGLAGLAGSFAGARWWWLTALAAVVCVFVAAVGTYRLKE